MLKLRLSSVAKRVSKKKVVYFILDHKRRELSLAAGTTKMAALNAYLTEHCRLAGHALAKEKCMLDDPEYFDIQPVTALVTKAKYKPQRLVGW
jgi:hypothetical protein